MSLPARAAPAPPRSSPGVVSLQPRPESVSDAELVRRALEDDAWARAALYHRHADAVANLALRLLRDRDQAADVLQDTFIEALTQLHRLREPEKVRAWLRRIAVNRVQRRFRRKKLLRMLGLDREPALGLDELASASASPEVRLELRRADGALRSLSTRRRVIWTLRVVEGETLPAIAEAVGLSLATVKRELTAATEAVRAAVEEAR